MKLCGIRRCEAPTGEGMSISFLIEPGATTGTLRTDATSPELVERTVQICEYHDTVLKMNAQVHMLEVVNTSVEDDDIQIEGLPVVPGE